MDFHLKFSHDPVRCISILWFGLARQGGVGSGIKNHWRSTEQLDDRIVNRNPFHFDSLNKIFK